MSVNWGYAGKQTKTKRAVIAWVLAALMGLGVIGSFAATVTHNDTVAVNWNSKKPPKPNSPTGHGG